MPVGTGPGEHPTRPRADGRRPAGMPAPGTTLGEHRLLHVIGEGGMGIVYLALDAAQRAVALKVLKPHIAGDPHARQRLGREVSTLERVRSPHVAEVLGADVSGQWPYLVTRYVPGRPLDAAVAADGPLTGRCLHELGHGLSEALAAIHAAGVVHRDLKPGNVLLLDGRPVVIDFGIAHVADDVRLTTTGLVMGTPGYLSPEVVGGGAVSAATDWWGWAATVAYAATGRPPFGRGPMEVVLDRVRRGDTDLAGLPPELQRLLSGALAVNPSHRPEPAALLEALDRACRDAGEGARVVTGPHPVVDVRDPGVRDAGVPGWNGRDRDARDRDAWDADATPPVPHPAAGAAAGAAAVPGPDADATRVVPVDHRSPFEHRTGLEVGPRDGWSERGRDFDPRPQGPRTLDARDAAVLRDAAAPRPEPESAAERTSVLPPVRHAAPPPQPGPHGARPADARWGGATTPARAWAAPPPGHTPPADHATSVLPAVPAAPPGQAAQPQRPPAGSPAAAAAPLRPTGWDRPGAWPPAPQGHPAHPGQVHPAGPSAARPAPPPGEAPRSAGTGVLLLALLALVGVCAVAPTAGFVLSVLGALVARTVDRSRGTLARRREVAGPRASDGFAVALAVPWNVLRAALTTVLAAIVPVLVGVSTLFVVGLLPAGPAGSPGDPTTLALGALAAVLTAWWGPGGRSLQRGTRTVVRAVAGGEREARVVMALCALLALSAAFMIGGGSEPDWRPLERPPFLEPGS
ncbi:serine/threonine-protein kinase [Kineococcus sp. NUM-3379]